MKTLAILFVVLACFFAREAWFAAKLRRVLRPRPRVRRFSPRFDISSAVSSCGFDPSEDGAYIRA